MWKNKENDVLEIGSGSDNHTDLEILISPFFLSTLKPQII